MKIRDLYNHCKENNKPMLMDNSLLNHYPNFPNSNANFVRDYMENYSKYDKLFAQRYSDKRILSFEEKVKFPAAYNDWLEDATALCLVNIFSWAYLYHSLNDEDNYWNPTHNYDGTSETTTKGKMEGLSGTDSVQSTNGATSGSVTEHSVPYDSSTEKETGKTTSHSDAVSNSGSTTYGRQNDVDYTVKEVKGGNLGVSTVPDMIKGLESLDSFFDTVFKVYSKELTVW